MKDKEKLKKEIWNYIVFEIFSLFKNRRKFLFLFKFSHMLPLLVLFFHFLAIYPCHLYLSVYLSVYITNWTNRNYNPSNTHLIGCTRSQDPIISLQILGFCSSYLKKESVLFLFFFKIVYNYAWKESRFHPREVCYYLRQPQTLAHVRYRRRSSAGISPLLLVRWSICRSLVSVQRLKTTSRRRVYPILVPFLIQIG